MSELEGHRDGHGRFTSGNASGPGRTRRAVEADYLAALSDTVPIRKWKRIVGRAVEDAEAGDRHAREWLGTYLLGKPDRGGLLDQAAKELVGYDSVVSRACRFAMAKPLNDVLKRCYMGTTADEPQEITPPRFIVD